MDPSNPSILLTFDVEDWFQVENLRQSCPISSWSSYELRVERNTHCILDLLDQAGNSPNSSDSTNSPKATFFILGWIAERVPRLIREIHARGHEIASHGYSHRLLRECSEDELKEDLTKSKRMLEDMIGEKVVGYRAPGFSVSDSVLRSVEDAGYLYDSSYNSFAANPRYGRISLTGRRKGIAYEISDTFYELPVSNLVLGGQTLPWGGGGYFRLIPYPLFRWGAESILRKEGAYLFYTHPWEVDAKQPRIRSVPLMHRFRHYVNLGKTCERLAHLLSDFKRTPFFSCRRYLWESFGDPAGDPA